MGGSDAESRSKIRTREESKSQSLSSSSARRPSPSLQKKHERSSEKKKMKRSRSSSSSSSSSTSSSREKKAKKKKKRREEKKLKREKKREKKEKKRQKKLALKTEREAVPASVPTPVSEEQLTPFLQTWLNEETKEPGPVMTDEQKDTFCTKRPMTKEEYDARQSIIRRVVDPETGRTRLIRGDGEVLEEIVTKERHKDINKQATKGDGDAFQKRLGINR